MEHSIPLSSDSPATSDDLDSFLRSIYPLHFFDSTPTAPGHERPFVTLTYAQSLDGKIAGVGGAQIRLSGDESMRLTHRLRELHDFILVGVGTMLSDDPQLNARIPTLLPLASQPRPLILDSHLRTPPSAKLMRNHLAGIGHQPTILHRPHPSSSSSPSPSSFSDKKTALEAAGASVVCLSEEGGSRASIPAILSHISGKGSLMVEGGATVISSFLASGLVDLVVVTIAPVFVGEGISMIQGEVRIPKFKHVASKVFGPDVVVVLRPE